MRRSTTLVDSGGVSALLDPSKRDALLTAVWLLISDPHKYSPTVDIAVGPGEMRPRERARDATTVRVTIVARGLPRRRVDPAIWDAIARVGSYTDSSHGDSVRVDVHCDGT